MTDINEIMVPEQWYMAVPGGGYLLDKALLDDILQDADRSRREKMLDYANRPAVVGRIDGVLSEQWLRRGELHRYYGVANNTALTETSNGNIALRYHDDWYIHGQHIK